MTLETLGWVLLGWLLCALFGAVVLSRLTGRND